MTDLLFRFHRGLLSESMKTVVKIDSRNELIDLIIAETDLRLDSIAIHQYYYDKRIDWDTYSVLVTFLDTHVKFPIGFLNKKPDWYGEEPSTKPDWYDEDGESDEGESK